MRRFGVPCGTKLLLCAVYCLQCDVTEARGVYSVTRFQVSSFLAGKLLTVRLLVFRLRENRHTGRTAAVLKDAIHGGNDLAGRRFLRAEAIQFLLSVLFVAFHEAAAILEIDAVNDAFNFVIHDFSPFSRRCLCLRTRPIRPHRAKSRSRTLCPAPIPGTIPEWG